MAKQTSAPKVDSALNATLIAFVEEKAKESELISTALSVAVKAGAVLGTAVHTGEASDQLKALGDQCAKAIQSIQLGDDDEAAALEGHAQFKLICGMVNAACKSAQDAVKRAALLKCEAVKMAEYTKKARDRITKLLRDHLALYSLKVNFQAVTFELVEAPEAETDAEKAAKAIKRGFELDGMAAVEAVASLPDTVLLQLVTRLQTEQANRARQALAGKIAAKRNEASRIAEQVRILRDQPQPDRAAIAQGVQTVKAIAQEWRIARRMLKAA